METIFLYIFEIKLVKVEFKSRFEFIQKDLIKLHVIQNTNIKMLFKICDN